jgi:similar to stage IV sporulation protein
MVKSYIEFTAFGVYCNQFIDYIVKSEHIVFDITSSDDIFTVKTAPVNYSSIARKAREFRVKTKVVRRSGWYFTLRRYRKRAGVIFGMLAFFGIIVLMSNFVWSIKIIGNEQVSDRRILEKLAQGGIHPGVSIHSFNANRAELELRLAIEELAWVSIERAGSTLNVKLSEVMDFSAESVGESDNNTPCNIIAGRSGQLIRAEVYRGELLYAVGSGINAGDIVVSGVISDFAGGQYFVRADAKLILEVVEVVDFFQPYTTLHRAKNGRSKSNRSIVFLGRRLGGEAEISKISKHADHIDYSESMTVPRVFGFPMPFRVLEQRYTFRDRVEVTDSAAVTREKLDKQIELYETNFLKYAEIIEKQAEYFPNEDGIGALVRYVFHTDAAEKAEIMIG